MTKSRPLAYDDLAPHAERIWRFIEITDDLLACMPWRGGTSSGYGHFGFDGRTVKAHRAVYVLTALRNGEELSGGTYLDHYYCDNPPCCNPLHVRPCTPAQNAQGMVERGRKKTKRSFTDEQAIQVRQRWAAGEGLNPLALEFGVTVAVIYKLAHGQSYRHLPVLVRPEGLSVRVGRAGESNHNAKFTSTQVAEIKLRLSAGESQSALAREFDVTRWAIYGIASGRRWAQVLPT